MVPLTLESANGTIVGRTIPCILGRPPGIEDKISLINDGDLIASKAISIAFF
jgi:hypothetical protein